MINVIIRKRPIQDGEEDIVDVRNTTINIYEKIKKVDLSDGTKIRKYNFDKIYSEFSKNEDIFHEYINEAINNMFDNKDYVCYAYGQTGSGKTHTIIGDSNDIGLIQLTVTRLFQLIDKSTYKILVSSYDIYNNNIYDLLNEKNKLSVREGYNSKIHIINIYKVELNNYFTFPNLLQKIVQNRNIGKSSQNNRSSRSHAIIEFQLVKGNNEYGKITFIDLAGNERGSQSICNNKYEYKENSYINRSLLDLKECIRALKNKKKHIPFRSSKLTIVLRNSFTNNCNTLMIGTISPEKVNIYNTLNTLMYTNDVKFIKKISYLTLPKIVNRNKNKKSKLKKLNHKSKSISLPSLDKKKSDQYIKKNKSNIKLPPIDECIKLNDIHITENTYCEYIQNSLDVVTNEFSLMNKILDVPNCDNKIDDKYNKDIIKLMNDKNKLVNDIYKKFEKN